MALSRYIERLAAIPSQQLHARIYAEHGALVLAITIALYIVCAVFIAEYMDFDWGSVVFMMLISGVAWRLICLLLGICASIILTLSYHLLGYYLRLHTHIPMTPSARRTCRRVLDGLAICLIVVGFMAGVLYFDVHPYSGIALLIAFILMVPVWIFIRVPLGMVGLALIAVGRCLGNLNQRERMD